jgi:pimeloyl-ACP methyl ester carboxylesterase
LRREGFPAIALDLPGHGRDRTPTGDITLDRYAQVVCDAINGASTSVILVGHSRGGIAISQAAEKCPGKISKLVYLAAFLIPDGQAMLPTALSDKESLIVPNLEVNEKEGWHMLKRDAFRSALYHDCDEEDVELASSLLTPEPNAPVGTPLRLTEANYGRVTRIYIETLDDKGITNSLQRKMYGQQPCERVLTMKTSHSPFLSAPAELASHLFSIARD